MKFSPGQIVCTRGALSTCDELGISPLAPVSRHLSGDWGDLDGEDKKANEDALKSGKDRILSMYKVQGEKFYCITEWDHSVTTLLLVEEY